MARDCVKGEVRGDRGFTLMGLRGFEWAVCAQVLT